MDMGTLWDQTCALLTQDMNHVSYITWVEGNMTPARMDGDTLTVCVKMDSMRNMILTKYGAMIEKRLSDAAGKPMKVRLMTRSEIEEQMPTPAPGPDDNDPHLNPKYTFENFVVGSGNRFAHAAALAVAESPAEAYNPLFIYGGVGLGKTHLMQAIGHFIHHENPNKRVVYMTSEAFTNALINAIQQKKTYEFREKIRKADVLMVDDIQFIAGRESTQQEFFNTFNELHNDNKQIILTSDKPPKDIKRLEERLCSRFEWGLVADIQRPDVDTRVAILREKIQQDRIDVPDAVLQVIAGKIESNIRELEGALTRLVAYANLSREPITMDLCERALKEIFDNQHTRHITAELVLQTVSDYYGLTITDLTGTTRKREVATPRQIAIYVTRELTGMSLPAIGLIFGGRDHTTMLYSCKALEKTMQEKPDVKAVMEDIKQRVKVSQ